MISENITGIIILMATVFTGISILIMFWLTKFQGTYDGNIFFIICTFVFFVAGLCGFIFEEAKEHIGSFTRILLMIPFMIAVGALIKKIINQKKAKLDEKIKKDVYGE